MFIWRIGSRPCERTYDVRERLTSRTSDSNSNHTQQIRRVSPSSSCHISTLTTINITISTTTTFKINTCTHSSTISTTKVNFRQDCGTRAAEKISSEKTDLVSSQKQSKYRHARVEIILCVDGYSKWSRRNSMETCCDENVRLFSLHTSSFLEHMNPRTSCTGTTES